MARRQSAATSSEPTVPPFDSPEFDELAKEWLEELIRQAKAKERPARAAKPQKPPPVTVPARGEGAYAFNFYLTNLYDLRTDPLGLMAGLEEVSRDALEDAVRDAGFSGLIAPGGPGMEGPISVAFDVEGSIRILAPGGAAETVH